MQSYKITRFEKFNLDWNSIPCAEISDYPWYEKGLKQETQFKLAIDQKNLYWKVLAQDIHSFAQVTELNGPVYADSCVEFFLSPRNELGTPYLNFEVNCCGTLHLAYGAGRENRKLCTLEEAAQIQIRKTILSPVKIEAASDQSWEIEMVIPLELIQSMTGEKLSFERWFANFYRCGGRVEDQYAVWNPIQKEQPDYHRPEQFGELLFTT